MSFYYIGLLEYFVTRGDCMRSFWAKLRPKIRTAITKAALILKSWKQSASHTLSSINIGPKACSAESLQIQLDRVAAAPPCVMLKEYIVHICLFTIIAIPIDSTVAAFYSWAIFSFFKIFHQDLPHGLHSVLLTFCSTCSDVVKIWCIPTCAYLPVQTRRV